jgi:hypothetical protein
VYKRLVQNAIQNNPLQAADLQTRYPDIFGQVIDDDQYTIKKLAPVLVHTAMGALRNLMIEFVGYSMQSQYAECTQFHLKYNDKVFITYSHYSHFSQKRGEIIIGDDTRGKVLVLVLLTEEGLQFKTKLDYMNVLQKYVDEFLGFLTGQLPLVTECSSKDNALLTLDIAELMNSKPFQRYRTLPTVKRILQLQSDQKRIKVKRTTVKPFTSPPAKSRTTTEKANTLMGSRRSVSKEYGTSSRQTAESPGLLVKVLRRFGLREGIVPIPKPLRSHGSR